METTIGGGRLGSGNKQETAFRNYERSTHDLSYIWRSTMASGTLVPFMTEVALPGDTFDIDLNCNVMTHPTIGPLFGSFKVQLDIFSTPIRLYNGLLHSNRLGIGMKMAEIKLPQIGVIAGANKKYCIGDNNQINPSCILSYLNIRGIGLRTEDSDQPIEMARYFNAVPFLTYWDIYKNYYANKQEEQGYLIHNPMIPESNEIVEITFAPYGTPPAYIMPETGGYNTYQFTEDGFMQIKMKDNPEPDPNGIELILGGTGRYIRDCFNKLVWDRDLRVLECSEPNFYLYGGVRAYNGWTYNGDTVNTVNNTPKLQPFLLSNIDEMKTKILEHTSNPTAFVIEASEMLPYGGVLRKGDVSQAPSIWQGAYSKLSSQEGLGIKTYQSDLFNNWISTEWIEGSNGINEITSIDTSGGSFSIDTLNLSKKVYDMLNRIAVSGGTYDDWMSAVYTHERVKGVESPVYMGSLIKELTFEEVVSNASSGDQPLGTLAGRGTMTNKNKGGKVRIKVNEPSYIMGIVSITPRLDYSQGNKWDTNIKTMDDFHKPALDGIGFQDLITDQMAWFDTQGGGTGTPIFKSAGKQPAWINYMTNVNQVRGNFAEENQQMWMTLNRKYEQGLNGNILDLTTYIDPTKFNHIFADTSIDAQNFWVQISNNITARRKMSAKVIPNL